MNWNTDKNPNESDTYLISGERLYGNGKLAFMYVAYFDSNTKEWYKYDPFQDKYKPSEKIEGVIAWGSDIAVFVR
jgi:hypothetical protein